MDLYWNIKHFRSKILFTNVDISLDDDAGIYSKLYQAHDNAGVLNAGSISGSSSQTVAGAETVNDLSSNEGENQTFNGAWANLGTSGTK